MSDLTSDKEYKIKCNKCAKTETVKWTETNGATKMDLKRQALSKGWAWVDKSTHFCPDHKPTKKAKAEKKASKPVAKKSSKKADKPAPVATPSVFDD